MGWLEGKNGRPITPKNWTSKCNCIRLQSIQVTWPCQKINKTTAFQEAATSSHWNQTAGATLENNAMEAKFTYVFAEGSFEVKLPTIWTDEKAEVGRVREEKRKKKRRRRRERRQKMQVREKVAKSRNTCFPMICGSGGSKSRLAKAAGAEPPDQMREKLHPVVARSTFRSQNVQNTPDSEHFWKLRCWKSARRCGAKHIWKEKM